MIFKGRHRVKARDNITIGGVNLQDVDETVYLGFKLQAGDSYNIILPDIAQFWRSVNIFFAEFGHIYPALQCKLFVQYCCSLYRSPLWRLSGDECRKICVGWRKAMRRLWRIYSMTHGVILALLAECPPMEIRMRERFHRFANGLFRSNNVSIIVQSIANVALCNPFSVFSNNCVTLNADVAFSPNVISNVKCMYDNWLNNINEAVKANANLIKELIDVRNGEKCVPILDMQDIMSIIQELCVA